MQPSSVLWDLDGTLVDSQSDIIDCIFSSIKAAGITVTPFKESIRVGPPIRDIIRGCLPHIEKSQVETIVSEFRRRYDYSEFLHTHPYSGIMQLLEDLRECQHFIVTNKPAYPTARLLNKLGWNMLFRDVYTPNRKGSGYLFSKTELISLVLKEHCLSPETCFFVGDTALDVRAAHGNGVRAIGVAWGYETPSVLSAHGVDWLASFPQDIMKVVLGESSSME